MASLFLSPLAAQDSASWTQWRGPNRDGIATETGWVVDSGGRKLWTKQVGMGYSTVVIANGLLFTQGHDKEKQEDTIFCLDAATGKEKWKHTFAAKTMSMAHRGGTLSTPSIDGTRLWALNREGNLFCFDAKSGKQRWHQNVIRKHGAKMPTWGFSASPLVLEEAVLVNVGKVIAFDRAGKPKWTSKDYGHAYSTPATFTFQGKKRLAVFNGAGIIVLDRATGKEVAKAPWKTRYDVNAATPVVMDDKIFVSSGYNRGCGMFEFNGKSLRQLWENRNMRNHMSGCVFYRGHLYGFDESLLKCLAPDGEVKWSQRRLGKGALVLADGKLVLISQRGDLIVADANPEEYRELSRNRVLSGGVKWSTPVLCGGLVYVRGSMGELACVDHRPAKKGETKKAAGKKAGDGTLRVPE